MAKSLRLGIAGLGTVGAGVVKLLAEHGRLLALRGGRPLKLVAVSARRKAKKRDIDLTGVRWERDPMALATAGDIDVVVELIGGSGGTAGSAGSAGSNGGGTGGDYITERIVHRRLVPLSSTGLPKGNGL